MSKALFRRLGVLLFAVVATLGSILPAASQVQPSYDTIRVQDGDVARLYQASILWSPLVLPTPDGGAWAFFTAQLRLPSEPGAEPTLSNFKVFSSRFDPAAGTWGAATALPGEISFGPAGVVDSTGTVHLVYTVRDSLEPDSFGQLAYIKSAGNGSWEGPTLVAASDISGHQLSPDLAIDSNDGLHVAWQDQRNVTDEQRAADASNADIFVADLNPDGTWSEPVQVSVRADAGDNGSRPQILADNDRLVLIWSTYSTTEEIGLDSAIHVQWATRPVADTTAWSEPQVLFDRGETLIGGRFLDADASATGDIVLLYGRRTETDNQIFLQRLPSGATEWSAASLIGIGNRGSYPRVTIANDGTVYTVYNLAMDDSSVKVGMLAVAPGESLPGTELAVTVGEEGQQGIPNVAVDSLGRTWVVYLHELPNGTTPSEVRVLRGALISSEPVAPAQTTLPPAASPEAEAAPEATPEG
ncbi:MAG: hypothetical protein IT339_09315 [Thermomicrobiales bacterium]|jgi:hypothetical protein|nr:hypothetical protein [Thermomicrobiales bacterium]